MQICPNCHVGKMLLRKVPYVQWYEDDQIIVDRIPALVCDNCDEKSYDIQALENLQQLLWSNISDNPASPFSRSR